MEDNRTNYLIKICSKGNGIQKFKRIDMKIQLFSSTIIDLKKKTSAVLGGVCAVKFK
jgi:hypothetical protein